jgi:DNA-binding CsgD family transcriptional regulator
MARCGALPHPTTNARFAAEPGLHSTAGGGQCVLDILAIADLLYAAALTPADWPAALTGMADLMRGHHATFYVEGGGGLGDASLASARVDEHALARSVSAYRHSDPGALSIGALPLGVVFSRAALISDRDFERSAYYNEVVRPINGFRSIAVVQRTDAATFMMNVCRPPQASDFETADMATLQRLLPHVAASVGLSRRLQAIDRQGAALTHVLDRLDVGVILTDATARPLFLNARAQRLTADCDGLSVDAARLATATPVATRRLREAVAEVAADRAVEARRLHLVRPSRRAPLLVSVLPFWRVGVVVPGAGNARAAIFVKEPDAPVSIDRATVADAFRLTRRESEIAVMLADGRDLNAIAAALGLGIGTVRFHLKRVFEKTGTHGQGPLVALIRGFTEPWN